MVDITLKYIVILAELIVCAPFVLIALGFALSLFKKGAEGVDHRYAIAYQLDELAASLFGKRGRTISGLVGEGVLNERWFIFNIMEWCIDHLPTFSRGHCVEAAKNELSY